MRTRDDLNKNKRFFVHDDILGHSGGYQVVAHTMYWPVTNVNARVIRERTGLHS